MLSTRRVHSDSERSRTTLLKERDFLIKKNKLSSDQAPPCPSRGDGPISLDNQKILLVSRDVLILKTADRNF